MGELGVTNFVTQVSTVSIQYCGHVIICGNYEIKSFPNNCNSSAEPFTEKQIHLNLFCTHH